MIQRPNGKDVTYQFPRVTLSIGIICHQEGPQHTLNQISELAAEAKKKAKQNLVLSLLDNT